MLKREEGGEEEAEEVTQEWKLEIGTKRVKAGLKNMSEQEKAVAK